MTSVLTSARQAAFFLQDKVTAWPWPALRHVTTRSPITLSSASASFHSPRSQVEIQAFILKREKKQRQTLVSVRMAPKHSARVLPFAFFPAGSDLVTSCCSNVQVPGPRYTVGVWCGTFSGATGGPVLFRMCSDPLIVFHGERESSRMV